MSTRVSLTNAGETGMVGKRRVQIVPYIPPHAQAICCMAHQQTFGANALEIHHELQLKENDRINGGTPSTRIGLLHQLAHEREVKHALQVTVAMIGRY